MNISSISGRITKDIELRKTSNGLSVVNFSVAVPKTKEEVDFINCVAWKQQADFLNEYAHKGDKVVVIGRLQNRIDEYQGVKRTITEIIVNQVELMTKQESKQESNYQPTLAGTNALYDADIDEYANYGAKPTKVGDIEIDTDDLPFY